jgi:predicted PurR-regulated permease PerM
MKERPASVTPSAASGDTAEDRQRLADVPVRDARRAFLTRTLFVVVLVLFFVMVRRVLIAGVLGAIIAVYLRPVHCWIEGRTGSRAFAAVSTLLLLIVPVLAALVYGYVEVYGAAEYLSAHTAEVAAEIDATLDALPFVGQVEAQATVERGLARAAELATKLPAGVQEALAGFTVAASVFLFTAFYVLTGAETIVAYLRGKVPARHAELAEAIEENTRGVLFGAVYGTLITQTLKALLIFVLAFAFGVPLPVVLAFAAFIIGFFPVVGSWTVYLPAAGYLLVFQDAPWEALAMAGLAAVGNTLVLSLIVRPKLAAGRSHVLDFYWMFIGLVAGVYAFGVPGIVLGPIIVGTLKAVFDTITSDLSWDDGDEEEEDEEDAPEAEVMAEKELRAARPPDED